MNEDDLRELLPAERPLPALRRHDMRERLAERIEQEGRASRRSYRAVVAVAAALVVVAGAVALLAGRGDDGQRTVTTPAARTVPDPAEAERAQEHLGGDRPRLDAEMLACTGEESAPQATPDGDGGPTSAQVWNGELTAGLEVEALVEVCARSYYYAVGGDVRPSPLAAEVCGREGAAGYVAAEVVFDGLACDDVGARRLTDADLADLDRRRAIEVALLADRRDCPTAADVVAWVDEVLAEEQLDLEVRIDDAPLVEPGVDEPIPPPRCPRFARVDWDTATVWVEPFRA